MFVDLDLVFSVEAFGLWSGYTGGWRISEKFVQLGCSVQGFSCWNSID